MNTLVQKTKKRVATSDLNTQKNTASKSNVNKSTHVLDDILDLHQTVGNTNVQKIFNTSGIQAKLNVSQPNDPFEQEAQRVADEIIAIPDSKVQEKSPVNIQRKTATSSGSSELSSSTESQINSLSGKGESLSPQTKAFFEPRFGHDFSNVRVHTDYSSSDLAQSINAKAFTKGYDIVFNSGEYSPNTLEGKKLLGHELTHVVQQNKIINQVNREELTDSKEKKVATLSIHTDLETENLGLKDLRSGNVGHAWVSMKWKNAKCIPEYIEKKYPKHVKYMKKKTGNDPFGFWPKMFSSYNEILDKWEMLPDDERVGYKTNPFASYVPGQVVHPDTLHKPRATQRYDINEKEAIKVMNYANLKKHAKYSVYFYNCTTFAKEAVEVAGKTPPSSTTLGIAYPNALYDGIVANQKKKIGYTRIKYKPGSTATIVEGSNEDRKKK